MDTAVLESCLRRGQFLEALDAVNGRRPVELRDTWALSLAAEALERTGHTSEADVAVDQACRRSHQSPRALARTLIVKGVLELEAGRVSAAISVLEQAVTLCQKHGFDEELCWGRIRLLLSRFESNAALNLDSSIEDVRRCTEGLADPGPTIALHVFASEIYAKRGLLKQSGRHLDASRGLSRHYDNLWLHGLIEIGTFCLNYLEMDYRAAESAATKALNLSRSSGHLRGEFAAITNLAHVWLRVGRLDDAAVMLTRASSMCGDSSPRCRDWVRDGIAQLEIQSGNLGSSSALVEQVLESSRPLDSYDRLWSALTKAEMLLRLGAYRDCRDHCSQALANSYIRADRGLSLRLRLTLSEALARLGAFSEAGHVAALARQDASSVPAGLLAEVNQRISTVLALGGLNVQARAMAERAGRLNSVAGSSSSHKALHANRECANQVAETVGSSAPLRDEFVRILDRMAALFEQAPFPECAAREIADLLRDLGCCRRWVVVEERQSGRRILSSSVTPAEGLLDEMKTCERVSEVTLLRSDDNALTVVLEPKESLEAIEAVSRTVKLIHYAMAVQGAALTGRKQDGLQSTQSTGPTGIAGVVELARRVASTDVPVLLLGETGVGKEWLARRIHEWSNRRAGRFSGFNCAAVSREMFEAQLFGHRRGAFTGALDSSVGIIRGAEGGTLLLDEVAEVPRELQAKLLRFLETGEVHAVGDVLPKRVDIRVIAATNRRAEELKGGGLMRSDLYYRLSVVRIEIPPLRQRKDEILDIAQDSLERFARQFGRGALRLSSECQEALIAYDWPGNIRQLVNEIRRVAALASVGGIVEEYHLSEDVVGCRIAPPRSPSTQLEISLNQPLAEATEQLERASIVHALRLCDGRREQAAALLGLSRKGLYLKCVRLGLEGQAAPAN